MILDKENLLSEDQAITVTANSTNVIDLGNDSARVQALNEKGDIDLLIQATETFIGGTSVKVTLQSDDDEAFGSATTLVDSAAIAAATLVAGYQYRIRIPKVINEQYIRAVYTVVGTFTAGKIMAGFCLDHQTNN